MRAFSQMDVEVSENNTRTTHNCSFSDGNKLVLAFLLIVVDGRGLFIIRTAVEDKCEAKKKQHQIPLQFITQPKLLRGTSVLDSNRQSVGFRACATSRL